MEMAKNARRSSDQRQPDTDKTEQVTTASKNDGQNPFPELPSKMVIAIDGWAQTGKNTCGALIGEHLGAVLVDSGRFYRALTAACLSAGININNSEAVVRWCKSVALDVRLARETGNVEEAQVAVNGHWFAQAELKSLGLQVSVVAAVPSVRELVNSTLRMCESYGRIVMLGRDIGTEVFPKTPYKFFLDATEEVREQRHVNTTNATGAVKRDLYDARHVMFAEDSLTIDTSDLSPAEVSGIILVEIFWRAEKETNDR